jgi:hypothetical protein
MIRNRSQHEGKVTKSFCLKPRGTTHHRQKAETAVCWPMTRHETKIAAHEDIEASMSSSHVVDFIPLARTELKRKAQEQQAFSRAVRTSAAATVDTTGRVTGG